MTLSVFPTLAGQTWPRRKIINTTTSVRKASGRRFALSRQIYPTYTIRIAYSFLRAADLATLGAFFKARGGRLEDFLFNDRDDNTAAAQLFGTGDGTTTTWQLLRAQGGYTEPVFDVATLTEIKVGGVATVAYTQVGGKITFTTAPAAAAALTWSGTYRWRVAFTKDQQEFDEFMRLLYSTQQVEFETVIP